MARELREAGVKPAANGELAGRERVNSKLATAENGQIGIKFDRAAGREQLAGTTALGLGRLTGGRVRVASGLWASVRLGAFGWMAGRMTSRFNRRLDKAAGWLLAKYQAGVRLKWTARLGRLTGRGVRVALGPWAGIRLGVTAGRGRMAETAALAFNRLTDECVNSVGLGLSELALNAGGMVTGPNAACVFDSLAKRWQLIELALTAGRLAKAKPRVFVWLKFGELAGERGGFKSRWLGRLAKRGLAELAGRSVYNAFA